MTLNTAFTWQGRETPAPNLAEVLESAIANAEEAARRASETRAKMAHLPVGDAQLPHLRYEARRFDIEQEHWRAMASDIRARMEAHASEVERALSRDVGADDLTAEEIDDERVSAWADIGGGVR